MPKRHVFRTAVVLAAVFFVVGLNLGAAKLWLDWPSRIFGDAGDGLFNLFVLAEIRAWLIEPTVAGFFGSGTFYPEDSFSMFFSDTLILPGFIYAFFRAWTSSQIAAFNLTALTLLAASFSAVFFFFHTIWRAAEHKGRVENPWWYLLVPVFATMAFFSAPWMNFTMHFQNMSAFWSLLVLTFCGRYLMWQRRADIKGIVLSFVAACWSAAYFMVLSVGLILIFGLLLYSRSGLAGLTSLFRKAPGAIFGGVVAISPVAVGYAAAQRLGQAGGHLPHFGLRFRDLFKPVPGTQGQWVHDSLGIVANDNHEKLAQLSPALCIAGLLLLGCYWLDMGRFLRQLGKSVWFWLLVSYFVIYQLKAAISDQALVLLVPYVAVVLVASVLGSAKLLARTQTNLVVPYLGAALFLVYGLAAGPSHWSFAGSDYSFWQIWGSIIPGAKNMRAVTRVAAIGIPIILGFAMSGLLGWVFYVHRRRREQTIAALVAVLVSWHLYDQSLPYYINHVDVRAMTPTEEEKVAVSKLGDVHLVVFPTTPWASNMHPILLFQNFPNVKLINGYSGRNSSLFHNLQHPNSAIPTDKQQKLASRYADYFVFDAQRYTSRQLDSIRERWPSHEIIGRYIFVEAKPMSKVVGPTSSL